MATSRKFCRFVKPSEDPARFESQRAIPSTFEMPGSGMCISAFLLACREGVSDEVLLGRLNPAAPWDEIGALGGSLLERASKGWMIPSSHLMLLESPGDAARRVLREQLGFGTIRAGGPEVFSDVYDHPIAGPNHWDVCYVFRVSVPAGFEPSRHAAWREIKFARTSQMEREELVRSHSDILEFAGFRFQS
jgi:ADP-ribose pyrophosphatase YjhB (NUDIX family)